ncbi:N-acetylglucosamine-6-phosphate deacetylase [Sphingobium lactosutens]|uniref:N-acetylglucosamine 6-phosphate deacetylase n=1 Tax=Sphingobium lactosutens DS20 TaxID=1331060 RepID=T0IT03_9SPHN|nr:N-acetylglucosamine-6-phosphate deacetylase [Sphingobium lactosutens]EQB12794.1 N-acetylglucosamine 6-phosphate deacetylase [Sphingobium lactosutens DS20]
MSVTALVGAEIVLPDGIAQDHALLIEGARIVDVVRRDALPPGCGEIELQDGWLLPGFIDTQVNGGGDVLLNARPDVEGIRAIAEAHRRFGTTGMMPTLISDDADVVDAAIAAGEAAIAQSVPGIWGVHVEGPHLNPGKKGIHDAAKFAPIDAAVLERYTRPTSGQRIVTLAPELAPPGAIRALAKAGVIVAAGHSLANYDQTVMALDEGLAGFTHLFNAMTQMGSREPGMVAAALLDRNSHFGLIVDGLHVHPAALRVALAARGLDGAMLVTDAMPPVGGTQGRFSLMGQDIHVVDGTCRGPDGTLAGSALSMAQALRNAMDMLGCSMVEASRMASGNPARFLRIERQTGAILPGLRADLVHLDAQRRVRRTWIAGDISEEGE